MLFICQNYLWQESLYIIIENSIQYIFIRGEKMVEEEEEYFVPESNWGRRAGAFFIDLFIVFILTYAIFLLFISNYMIFLPFPVDNLLLFVIFWIVVGIITIVFSGVLEGTIDTTVGKGVFGLQVYSLDTETMTVGKGILRSVSKLVWFFVPIDMAAGKGKGDPRQRALDLSANTIVADRMLVEQPAAEPSGLHRGEIYVKPIETKSKEDKDSKGKFSKEFIAKQLAAGKEVPIPKELRSGKCSRCGTPYNIVKKEDGRWSGLWNLRCIWCNKMVFEEYTRRSQPGKWV